MEFVYLGTASAEGWPALFCSCNACLQAREKGGRNVRGRSQALVDGELLLDLPADTFSRTLEGRLDLTAVRHCLITHSHSDHLYPADLEMRRTGFAHPATAVLSSYTAPKPPGERFDRF